MPYKFLRSSLTVDMRSLAKGVWENTQTHELFITGLLPYLDDSQQYLLVKTPITVVNELPNDAMLIPHGAKKVYYADFWWVV